MKTKKRRQVAVNKHIIAPADASWDDFFAAPGIGLGAREQPEPQVRESL